MTEVNPYDPDSNENGYMRPATTASSQPARRKGMAVDMQVCLAVLVVCVLAIALMAHW